MAATGGARRLAARARARSGGVGRRLHGLGFTARAQGGHRHRHVNATYTAALHTGKVRSGLAAPLYRKGAPHTALAGAPCARLSAEDARRYEPVASTTCSVRPVQLMPYVGGLGWVRSAAESWALVPLSLHLNGFEGIGNDARYDTVVVKDVRVTVDGKSPTTEILRYRDPDPFAPARDDVLVFRTTRTPTTLRLSTTLRAAEPGRIARSGTTRRTS